MYRIFTELIDGTIGALAALLTASIPIFREQSIMVMSEIPALLGMLLLIWIWIRWRKTQSISLAPLGGFIAGWLAIVRPVDALVAIIPVVIAVFVAWASRPCKSSNADTGGTPIPQRAKTTCAAMLGAAPFVVIQLVFNVGVTGSLTQTPFTFYARQVYPGATYGFRGNTPTTRPSWPLPQIQKAYDALAKGDLAITRRAEKLYSGAKNSCPAHSNLCCRIAC